MRSKKTLLILLACRILWRIAALPNRKFRDVVVEKSEKNTQDAFEEKDDVEERFITQRLDHFDPSNVYTYQQRYFSTDRYVLSPSKTDLAVTFLCVGGEGPSLSQSVLVNSVHCTGDMLELAKRLSANERVSVHVFALEHRYYGKSFPTFSDGSSPVTNRNLKYLSSRQALEDLAHFVSSMKNTLFNGGGNWYTFGGSYPGFLAAQARLKYPHLIYGAVSNSAPLDVKVDFPEYQQAVGFDLQYEKVGGSPTCYSIVKNGHNEASALLAAEGGPKQLAEMFHVCNPDTSLFARRNQNMLLGDGLINVPAQGNDASCHVREPSILCNIDRLCNAITEAKVLTNHSDLSILASIASRQRKQLQGERDDCVQVDWNKTLIELSQPIADEDGTRSWLWQTCTEFGYYQTCKENCPYSSFYHLVDMDLELCRVAFGITNVYDNVQATVDFYGGLEIGAGSRVLSVNGDVDPWASLAVKVAPTHSLPVLLVRGASHHFWTHEVLPTDLPEIVKARAFIYSTVYDWMGLSQSPALGKALLRGRFEQSAGPQGVSPVLA